MKRFFAVLLLSLQLTSNLYSAELSVSNEQLPISLGLYLDHFEDSTKSLTIAQVMGSTIEWERSSQAIPTLGFSGSAHWFFIDLTSPQISQNELLLSIDAPTIDRIDFYQVYNNEIVSHFTAGDTVSLSEQELAHRVPVFPVSITNFDSSSIIYLRVISQSGIELPLVLSTAEQLLVTQQNQFAFFGAFFVFFVLSFALCLVSYYVLREKQFLGYTLFFGSSIIFFLTVTGMGRVWFWPESLELNNRLSYATGGLLVMSFCMLGQSLNVENRFRNYAVIILRFLFYAMIPTALYFLVLPIDYITGSNIETMLGIGLLVAFLVFALTVMAASQGSRVALYLVGTWTFLLLAYLSMLAYKLNILEKTDLSAYIAELLVGFSALTLLLSLAEFIRLKNEEFTDIRLETKAKSDFLKNVSREFLTPVHLILANSKRMLETQELSFDKTADQQLDTVIRQSEHLHNLINDLLEMAEIESDSFEAEFELVEITQFLGDIKNMMLPAASEKNLKFDTQFTSPNLLVQTDKSRLQHVLINLIANAVRFTSEGEISLGFQAIYFHRKLGIEIFIRDTGSGMSDEFKSKMFEEFSHSEDFSELNPTNTGLGMVIVKRVIEKLGGEIVFESKIDSGSEFFIRLPLRQHTQ